MTKLYNVMSLAELQEKAPNLQWVEYINNILPENVTVRLTAIHCTGSTAELTAYCLPKTYRPQEDKIVRHYWL